MVKIGVISDTHLLSVSNELEYIYDSYFQETDIILHAGDYVSSDVMDFMNARESFYGVLGNMDPSELRGILPIKKIINTGKFRLGLIHGWGPPTGLENRIASEFTDVDAIVYGHSHRAANHVRNNVLFFNPGTATGPSYYGSNSIGILEIGDRIKGEIIRI